jgi:ADP-heptose:LPS heptosyltransferase
MYREKQPGLLHMNVLMEDGGLGDSIARLPAIKYVADHHKHIQQHLWVHKYFKEFAKNCLVGTNVIVRGWDEEKKFKPRLTRCFGRHIYNNMASHLTKHAFHVLVNKDVEDEFLNYLQPDLSKVDIIKFNLPKNYVVMTTGFTANARQFYSEYINEINAYIVSRGYSVVFLGKKEINTGTKHIIKGAFSNEIDFSIGYNLIDQTSLLETTKIISEAKTIIGLDNGILHLAGCTDIPIVGSFSSVEPRFRMPYRRNILGWNYYPVVPDVSLKCRFCQSNQTYTHGHSFTECYYKDYACLNMMKPNLYIEQLEKLLGT